MESELESSSILISPMERYTDFPKSGHASISIIPENSHKLMPEMTTPATSKLLSRGESNVRRRRAKQRIAMMTQESSELAEKRLRTRDVSIRKIQRCWLGYCSRRDFIVLHKLLLHYQLLSLYTRKKYVQRKCFAQQIQHWWRDHLRWRRERALRRFTQDGKWTKHQADLVFALLLGYRLRRKMKTCPHVLTSKRSLEDAWKVLEGIAQDACAIGTSDPPRSTTTEKPLEVSAHDIIHVSITCARGVVCPTSFNVDGARLFRLWNCGVSMRIDWPFARMFAKQVLSSRQQIWDDVIGSSSFYLSPPPGYWHVVYHPPGEEVTSRKAHMSTDSPSVAMTTSKGTHGHQLDGHVRDIDKACWVDMHSSFVLYLARRSA